MEMSTSPEAGKLYSQHLYTQTEKVPTKYCCPWFSMAWVQVRGNPWSQELSELAHHPHLCLVEHFNALSKLSAISTSC